MTKEELMLAINQQLTTEELVTLATEKAPHVKDALALFTNHRQSLITKITTAPNSKWTESELATQSVNMLQKIADMIPAETTPPPAQPTGDFLLSPNASGRTQTTTTADDLPAPLDEPMIMY